MEGENPERREPVSESVALKPEIARSEQTVTKPMPEATPEAAVCGAHNATENTGYHDVHDSQVYSSYDTGANADENSVVG